MQLSVSFLPAIIRQPIQMLNLRLLAAGIEICEHVSGHPMFTKANRIGLYLSCAKLREVDTRVLVEHALRTGRELLLLLGVALV